MMFRTLLSNDFLRNLMKGVMVAFGACLYQLSE